MSNSPDPPEQRTATRRRLKRRATDVSTEEILESMSDAFAAIDREWRCTYLNRAAERITHLRREKMLGRTVWEVFPTYTPKFEQAVRRAMDERVTTHNEEYYAPLDMWFENTIYPAADGITLYSRDVTSRKRLEDAQLRLALIVELSDDGIISKDLNGRITSWNASAERIFGYTEAEAVGQPITIIIPPELREQETMILSRLRAGQRIEHYETVRVDKQGQRLNVSLTISPIKDAEGRITGASKIARDITERKRLEETLRERERFIRQITELSPVVLTVFDLVTQHDIYISSDVINIHGYTPDELTRMKDLFTDLLHPEDALRVRDHFARLKQAEDGEVREIEYRIRHRNGEWRWSRSRHMPFARNDQGVVQQVVTATLDITERKQAEEALRERDERFRSYFELGLIGMAITSPTKGIIEVNNEICRILGYERSELLQMTWAELTHPDDVAADAANFNRVMAGEIDGYVMDKRWIHKDGQIIDATISVKCLRRADGTVDYFIALLQDITTRKQAEAALQRAHNELERV